jgi:hypothetical protein
MLDELLQRLETTPPGPGLAALLASVDRAGLDGSGVLALAQALGHFERRRLFGRRRAVVVQESRA